MSVISFATAKAEREPHWAGKVVCLGCRHEWVGVGPIGRNTDMECPSCGTPKGVTKHLFGPDTNDSEFRCACGCEALNAYLRQGRFFLKCMACGADQTNAIYGDAP